MPSRGKAARTVLESNSSLQEAGNARLLTILCRSDGGNDFSKTPDWQDRGNDLLFR